MPGKQKVADHFIQFLPDSKDVKMLEVGAGTGLMGEVVKSVHLIYIVLTTLKHTDQPNETEKQ